MIVRTVSIRGVSLRKAILVTIINVKPYWVIMRDKKILCDGNSGLPLVFDTKDLAMLCIQDNGLRSCRIKKLELEELAHKCRDRKVPFDSFILIDKPSQLDID